MFHTSTRLVMLLHSAYFVRIVLHHLCPDDTYWKVGDMSVFFLRCIILSLIEEVN